MPGILVARIRMEHVCTSTGLGRFEVDLMSLPQALAKISRLLRKMKGVHEARSQNYILARFRATALFPHSRPIVDQDH